MKVIALEALMMRGTVIQPGESVDIDESALAPLTGLVKPVKAEQSKTVEDEQPPVAPAETTVETPAVSTPEPPASNQPPIESKKEGKKP